MNPALLASPADGEEPAKLSESPPARPEDGNLAANGVSEVADKQSAATPTMTGARIQRKSRLCRNASDPPEPVVTQPTTMLIFKDGHRSEVVNYAIVGDTLFDFSGDRTHKILISDLDIPATQKANDASGVEFKLPPPVEAPSSWKATALIRSIAPGRLLKSLNSTASAGKD